MVSNQANTTVAHSGFPQTFLGVTWASHCSSGGEKLVQLTGIKMAQPSTESTTKMLRHMRVKRMNMAASRPTRLTTSCSEVDHSGTTHAKMPFPRGGGACFSSACLSFGEYTTLLYGRRKEKQTAMAAVMPREVPRET